MASSTSTETNVINTDTGVNLIRLNTNTNGNLLYTDASGVVQKLPIGAQGEYLTVDTSIPNKIKWSSNVSGVATNSTILALANTKVVLSNPINAGLSYSVYNPHTLDDNPPINYIEGFYIYYPAVVKRFSIWPISNNTWPASGINLTIQVGLLTNPLGGEPDGEPYVDGLPTGSLFTPLPGTGNTITIGPGDPLLGNRGGKHVISDVNIPAGSFLSYRCTNTTTLGAATYNFSVCAWLQRLYF